MKHTGRYNAVGNLFWVNFTWRSSKHVWTNLKSVRELQATHFAKGPAPLPWESGRCSFFKGNDCGCLGEGVRQPETCQAQKRQRQALLLAVAQRIKDGAKDL